MAKHLFYEENKLQKITFYEVISEKDDVNRKNVVDLLFSDNGKSLKVRLQILRLK